MTADAQQQAAGVDCPWEMLDAATLGTIVGFLDDAKDLASLQSVNKELHELVGQNVVWLPLLAKQYGLHLTASAHHRSISMDEAISTIDMHAIRPPLRSL